MQFCKDHWEQMREEIKKKGLFPFVAKSGEELVDRFHKQFNKEVSVPDPLMTIHNMMLGRALEVGGFYIMAAKPDGSHYCPLCELNLKAKVPPPTGEKPSDWWIRTCTEYVVEDFKKAGWLNEN